MAGGADQAPTGARRGPSARPATRRSIRRETGVAEEVFDILRGDIMSLRIPPDTRMSIDNLARELGVSQTPIREAMRQLEAMGLVTKRHFVGYCSAPQLTRRQFDELFEMRLQLEPYAARCAATRMDEQMLAQVRALAERMRPGESPPSYTHFAEADAELHDLVAAGSANRIIRETLSRLHLHFHIFRLRFHSNLITDVVMEHDALVAALIARDGEAAERAMREHIERSYRRFSPVVA
jgi:DNA-binding GntR family transcriptional regulator